MSSGCEKLAGSVLLLTGLMLVSACKTTAEYTAEEAPLWTRPDNSAGDFAVDRKACVDYVELALYEESWVSPIIRMSAAERYAEASWWAGREYVACMQEKGWQPAQGARIPTPRDISYPF